MILLERCRRRWHCADATQPPRRWSERESRVRLQQQMRQMKLEAPNSLSLAVRADAGFLCGKMPFRFTEAHPGWLLLAPIEPMQQPVFALIN